MSVKLLMTWDIQPGKETAYFNFVVHEFAPRMMELGLRPTDAWYTVYGKAPQIQTGGEADDLKTLERIMESPEWQALMEKLSEYITHYREKVVPSTGGFQIF